MYLNMLSRKIFPVLFVASLMIIPNPTWADPAEEAPTCRRFASQKSVENALTARLGRLCVRLVDASNSADGLSPEEIAAATRLGQYLAVLGELELRRGTAGIGGPGAARRSMTDTARYLIADRMGLISIADTLAPPPPRTAALQ